MITIISVEPPKKKYDPVFVARCCCGITFTFNESDQKIECFGHGDFQPVVHCPRCGRTNDYATVDLGEMEIEYLSDGEITNS